MNSSEPRPSSRTRKFASRCLIALVLVGATNALAEEEAKGEKACQARANALSELACELSRSVSVPTATLVVAGPPTADAPLNQPDELSRRVARVVSGALGEHASPHTEAVDLARAQSLARDLGTLLYLSIEIAHGKIRVTADMYRVKKNFWDRVRDRAPTPTQHGFAETKLDPEVRSFLPFVPVVAQVSEQAMPPERAPVALACGDADGDGSLEIAFVGRHRVFLGRIEGKRFITLAEKPWASLSPVAAAPLQEPIAAAWFRPDGTLDLGSSDRADFVRVDGALDAIAHAERRVPWAGACLRFEGTALSPVPVRCLSADQAPAGSPIPFPLDSVATEDGASERPAVAGRDAKSNQVFVRSAASRGLLPQAGAQLAVADLNGDGKLELLSSENTHDEARDVLTIHTLTSSGKLEQKARIPVNEGITALAVCPEPSQGLAPVLVGTRARLWVIR